MPLMEIISMMLQWRFCQLLRQEKIVGSALNSFLSRPLCITTIAHYRMALFARYLYLTILIEHLTCEL